METRVRGEQKPTGHENAYELVKLLKLCRSGEVSGEARTAALSRIRELSATIVTAPPQERRAATDALVEIYRTDRFGVKLARTQLRRAVEAARHQSTRR